MADTAIHSVRDQITFQAQGEVFLGIGGEIQS
jgi:hypothetical protein